MQILREKMIEIKDTTSICSEKDVGAKKEQIRKLMDEALEGFIGILQKRSKTIEEEKKEEVSFRRL